MRIEFGYLHWETLSSLSDLRRTRHFHGLKILDKEANLDLLRSSGKLFQLLMGADVVVVAGATAGP